MSVYPDVITVVRSTLPLSHSTSQAVLKTEFNSGVESRRLLNGSLRRQVSISYATLIFSEANVLRRFYEARKGSFESFSFYYPQDVEAYVFETVGTMPTTLTTTLSLPSLNAVTPVLYRNGDPLILDTDWTFSAASGTEDGEDIATLLFTPTAGDIYHLDFDGGRLRIKARFSDSNLVFSDVKKYWSSTNVDLIGLEPEL